MSYNTENSFYLNYYKMDDPEVIAVNDPRFLISKMKKFATQKNKDFFGILMLRSTRLDDYINLVIGKNFIENKDIVVLSSDYQRIVLGIVDKELILKLKLTYK